MSRLASRSAETQKLNHFVSRRCYFKASTQSGGVGHAVPLKTLILCWLSTSFAMIKDSQITSWRVSDSPPHRPEEPMKGIHNWGEKMRCSAKIEEALLFFPSKEACSSPASQQTHDADSKARSLPLPHLKPLTLPTFNINNALCFIYL